MTEAFESTPETRSLLDIVERASLFALLQQALEHQKQPEPLPRRLYDDLNVSPSQRPDLPHGFAEATVFQPRIR